GRQVEVVAEGRGAAARPVRTGLGLPPPEGEVALEQEVTVEPQAASSPRPAGGLGSPPLGGGRGWGPARGGEAASSPRPAAGLGSPPLGGGRGWGPARGGEAASSRAGGVTATRTLVVSCPDWPVTAAGVPADRGAAVC